MRISDWSSDVCSSDLQGVGRMNALVTPTARGEISCTQATLMALDEAMGLDPSVLVFGEDVADPEGGGIVGATAGLSAKYGDSRGRSTPLAEQAIVGAAVGAAIAGKIGRASCRERGCQYVSVSVVGVSLK